MHKSDPNISVISLRGNQVIDSNDSTLALFKCKNSADLIGKDIHNFFPSRQSNGEPSKKQWAHHLQSAKTGLHSFNWEFKSDTESIGSQVSLLTLTNLTTVIVRAEKDSPEIKDEKILRDINQKIEEGIYRSSLDTGFSYVNRAFIKMFGFKSECEVMQMKPEDINELYETKHDINVLFDKLEKQGFIRNHEVLFKRKDGSRFWGLHSCYVNSDENNIQYLDGIIVDITPIKESENLLKEKNRQLRKVTEEMDRFVYSVSHDLRAPLSSILGLLNLAEVETETSQLAVFIQMMKKSVRKLDHFINEILDYTRNARLKLEDDKIDLEELVNTIIQSIENINGASSIRKIIKVDARSELVTDKKRVTIILTNLITNSLLYHDLSKESPFIEVNALIDEEKSRIQVIDNGTGIPANHLDKIFKMFYRASEDSKGSGLGLFMVKECVEKLQGSINVSSTLGIGTKFEVIIKNFQKEVNTKTDLLQNDPIELFPSKS